MHAVQEAAAPAGLLAPGGQKEHAWFTVLEPGVVTYAPAAHVVHGTHAE